MKDLRVLLAGSMLWPLMRPALVVMLLSFPIAHAQQLTATLSGIVADRTDARVPGAMILLTNQASGDRREIPLLR